MVPAVGDVGHTPAEANGAFRLTGVRLADQVQCQDRGERRIVAQEGVAVGLVRIVVDAAAAAEHRLVVDAVGEAKARRPIGMLGIGEVKTGRASHNGRLRGIELGGVAVYRVGHRRQLVAQPVVQRQFARDLPLVLHEEAVAPFGHVAVHFGPGRGERLRNPENEVGRSITGQRPVEGKSAARAVGGFPARWPACGIPLPPRYCANRATS